MLRSQQPAKSVGAAAVGAIEVDDGAESAKHVRGAEGPVKVCRVECV